MERWTTKDEADLQRLIKRKEDLMSKNMAPLVALVKREDLSSGSNEYIAKALATVADEFRVALEPFDSGIRVAPSNVLGKGRPACGTSQRPKGAP